MQAYNLVTISEIPASFGTCRKHFQQLSYPRPPARAKNQSPTPEVGLTMSDRIAVFNKGRIEQIGTPEELYDRPIPRFVADFLGETNFLPGRVVASEGLSCRVRIGDQIFDAQTPAPAAPGAPVVLAVRPERLKLGLAAADGEGLRGTLVDIVYLGNARRSIVRLADGRDCFVFQHATQADELRLAPGQALRLSWESHQATVFPADAPTT